MKAWLYVGHSAGEDVEITIIRETKEYDALVRINPNRDVSLDIPKKDMDALCAAWLKECKRGKAKYGKAGRG